MSPRLRSWRRHKWGAARGGGAKGARLVELASDSQLESSRFWLGVRPTRDGLRLLFLLVVMGFAAFNTRNNLLYLMFSVGVASAVISVLAGWLSLRRLELVAEENEDLYAGTKSTERFLVRNRSRLMSAYGVELEEVDFPGPSPAASVTHLGRGETATVALEKVYFRRGVFESERMRLMTGFAFGLFQARREVRLARKITVFPHISQVDISFAFQGRSGSVPKRQCRGESEELLRLREYASGDNLHHIHWKSTAKLGRLMVREFSDEQRRCFSIVFDNTGDETPGASSEPFEPMVSAAASLASHLAAHGLAFSFASIDDTFPHGASIEHLRGVLMYLAVVQPRLQSSGPDLVTWAGEAIRRDETVFVLSYRQNGPLRFLSAPQLHLVDPATVLFQEQTVSV